MALGGENTLSDAWTSPPSISGHSTVVPPGGADDAAAGGMGGEGGRGGGASPWGTPIDTLGLSLLVSDSSDMISGHSSSSVRCVTLAGVGVNTWFLSESYARGEYGVEGVAGIGVVGFLNCCVRVGCSTDGIVDAGTRRVTHSPGHELVWGG